MRKQILILGHNDATQFIDIYNQYTRLFDPAHYTVTVALLSGKDDSKTRARLIAPEVVFFNLAKNSLRYLKLSAILKVRALCQRKKFSLVICHRYKPTFIMLLTQLSLRIPRLIFVMHELNTMQAWGRRILVALLFRPRMLFAGVSNAVRDDLRGSLKGLKAENVITLYNTIDAELTEPQFLTRIKARSTLAIPTEFFLFANIARLATNKDHRTLIRAFIQAKPRMPLAKLIIIGDGHLEEDLKKQIALSGIENDIILTGFIPEAFKLLKAFDCFILSSIQEAFGRVLIEAMLAQLPIISTHVNGIPEVVRNHGTLVAPGDVDAIAKAMCTTYQLSGRERATLAQSAYRHVLDQFTIPAFYEIFWNIPAMKGI